MAAAEVTEVEGYGMATYPADVEEQIDRACTNARGIDALAIAKEAGNAKAVNMVMDSSVIKQLPINVTVVEDVVGSLSKDKGIEVNLKALAGGAS